MQYATIFGDIEYASLRAILIAGTRKRFSRMLDHDIEETVDEAIAAVVARAAAGKFTLKGVPAVLNYLKKTITHMVPRSAGRAKKVRCDSEIVESQPLIGPAPEQASVPQWLARVKFTDTEWMALHLVTFRVSLDDIDAILGNGAYQQGLRKAAYRLGKARANHGLPPFRERLEGPLVPHAIAERIRDEVKRLRGRVLRELRRRNPLNPRASTPDSAPVSDAIHHVSDDHLFAAFTGLSELIEIANTAVVPFRRSRAFGTMDFVTS